MPFIRENGNLTALHFQEDGVQSLMDKTQPDSLMLSYTEVMMGFVYYNPSPDHIGIIGLGGGSIPKYCYKDLPTAHLSVAEISPEVVALRAHFHIPDDNDRFQVYLEDGVDFVARQRGSFDVLLIDAFDAEG
jgi:spermidine synthase